MPSMFKSPSAAHRILQVSALAMIAFVSVGLDGWEVDQLRENSIVESLKPQVLKVHILEHPLIYKKESGNNIWGQDFETLSSFAKSKGLKIQFIPHKNAAELYESYKNLDGDIWVHRWPTFKLFGDSILKGPDL